MVVQLESSPVAEQTVANVVRSRRTVSAEYSDECTEESRLETKFIPVAKGLAVEAAVARVRAAFNAAHRFVVAVRVVLVASLQPIVTVCNGETYKCKVSVDVCTWRDSIPKTRHWINKVKYTTEENLHRFTCGCLYTTSFGREPADIVDFVADGVVVVGADVIAAASLLSLAISLGAALVKVSDGAVVKVLAAVRVQVGRRVVGQRAVQYLAGAQRTPVVAVMV